MRKLRKSIATMFAALAIMTLFTVNALAATDLMKDGKILSGGFVNAGEEVDPVAFITICKYFAFTS